MENEDRGTATQILHDMAKPVESLVNLLYLIKHNLKDKEAVLYYVELANTQTQQLVELLERGPHF